METEDRVDPRDTRRYFDKKALDRARILDERFAAAWADARNIVSMLEREYGVLRIWQWGSLLDRRRFSEISDIDIAVEGVADTETLNSGISNAITSNSSTIGTG